MNRKKVFILPLVAVLLALVFTGCGKSGSGESGQKYHCPMHPTYVSDKPGDCPICNMKLVPIKSDKAPAGEKKDAAKPARYHCPMHPTYTSDKPADCPICNMKLVPIKEDQDHAAHTAKQGPAVPGRIAVSISAEKQQLIGLTTAVVMQRELSQPVRTIATFEHDETRLARIAPRFGGWVRELKINSTGQPVVKGEPLLTVYSPELFSAETEYLLAYHRLQQLATNSPLAQRESAERLLDSVRTKLSLWQIGADEIRALEQNGKPTDELLLRSPVSGHVIAKNAIAGKAFMPGDTLYEIGDLTHVWLRAYVYEYELPLIKAGQKARVVLPYLGNKTYESTVTFIYPHIEPQTRRAQIRLELENPNHELRPQMWGNVELDASFGEVLAVPASAVIDTGVRFVAFVQREDNHLEPRELKIGARTDDYWQVTEGLKEGEKVVVRALFLVDSESQLKAAISGMGEAGGHQH
jgi:membrane fusion protein, copper/silver efflux system